MAEIKKTKVVLTQTKKPNYIKTGKEGLDRWDRGGMGVCAPFPKKDTKKGK